MNYKSNYQNDGWLLPMVTTLGYFFLHTLFFAVFYMVICWSSGWRMDAIKLHSPNAFLIWVFKVAQFITDHSTYVISAAALGDLAILYGLGKLEPERRWIRALYSNLILLVLMVMLGTLYLIDNIPLLHALDWQDKMPSLPFFD